MLHYLKLNYSLGQSILWSGDIVTFRKQRADSQYRIELTDVSNSKGKHVNLPSIVH